MNRLGAALLVSLTVLTGAACGDDSASPRPTLDTPMLLAGSTTTSTTITAPVQAAVAPAPAPTTMATVAPTTAAPPPPPTTPAPTPPPTAAPPLSVPIAPPPEDGNVDSQEELGSIEIPRIDLQRTMYEGIRLSTLDRGPGHWPGTAMPGDLGNVVVAGHRVSHNEDFRNLDQLEPGDEVIFNTASGRHTYHVLSTEVVGPEAIWIVDQTPAATGTLFACHPPGSTRQRIVVHLELAA